MSQDFLKSIEKVRFNPTEIQRLALQHLETLTDGEVSIVNASNPFVFLLEAASVVAAAGMSQNHVLNRRQYPSNAITHEDLYPHMSDEDFIGVFALPSRTTFTIALSKEEAIAKALPFGTSGSKKMVIPRHTEFLIADTRFTMQYPIDIVVASHGGISLSYNVEKTSPIRLLETNNVDWFLTTTGGVDFIIIQVPVDQMRIKSYTESVNKSTGFKKVYNFETQFYHARAYIRNLAGQWEEIKTTHTEQVFDPLSPTVSLKVIDKTLTAVIPQIYLTEDMIGSELRLDVYTTKGDIEMSLDDFDVGEFQASWIDYDEDDDGKYYSALETFSTISVFSDKKVFGGGDGLTFEELRERVIMNSLGPQNVPITNVQLVSKLSNLGYEIVKNLDTVTNRQFLASRALPIPSESEGVTAVASTMLLLQSTFNALTELNTVRFNAETEERLTILPKTVYRNTDGVIDIVGSATVDALLNLGSDALAGAVNSDTLLYSPFHYVFDISDDEFETRAYLLTAPEIVSKVFKEQNDTTGLQVNIQAYQITPDGNDSGYYLDLLTLSNDAFKGIPPENIFAQISYIPPDSSQRVFMTAGVMETSPSVYAITAEGEMVIRFHITTNFDLDKDDNLILDSFKVLDNDIRDIPVSLDVSFDCVIIVDNHEPAGLAYTDIDSIIDTFYLSNVATNHAGVSHEKVRVRFGHALKWLWRRARSVIGSLEYQTYAQDEYAFYSAPVYDRDPLSGNIIFNYNSITGQVEYVKLWDTGDPVLNTAGEDAWDAYLLANPGDEFSDFWDPLDIPTQQSYQEVAHLEGETVFLAGVPVIDGSVRDIVRQADIFLIDAKLYFATSQESVAYREALATTVAQWIVDDIDNIAGVLLEETEMFYYPKKTVGEIQANIGEDEVITLKAEQSLVVQFHVSAEVYADAELRDVIELATAKIIDERLSRTTVSLDDITDMVKEGVGENIISVNITGLFGSANVTTASITNLSTRFTLGKRLTVLADGSVGMEDAISFVFIKHRG